MLLYYAEIKHSDWLLQDLWRVLTNQRALFQHNITILPKNLYLSYTLAMAYGSRVFVF